MTRKPSNIEDVLRKAVKAHGIYKLAQAARIDNAMLYRFVNGKRGISLTTAATLCKHLRLRLIDA